MTVNDHVLDLNWFRNCVARLQNSVLSGAPLLKRKYFSTATREIVHMTPMSGRVT